VAFVCGVVEHRAGSPLDKGRWSWPFGRVDLGEAELVAYSPIFFGRFAVRLRYGEIVRAVVKPNALGGKVRLQRTAGGGDVTIATLGASYLQVADVLRDHGVHVTGP